MLLSMMMDEAQVQMITTVSFTVGVVTMTALGFMVAVFVSGRLKRLQADNEALHEKLNDIRAMAAEAQRIVKDEAEQRRKRHEERIARREVKRERREAFKRGMEIGGRQAYRHEEPVGERCFRAERHRRRRHDVDRDDH